MFWVWCDGSFKVSRAQLRNQQRKLKGWQASRSTSVKDSSTQEWNLNIKEDLHLLWVLGWSCMIRNHPGVPWYSGWVEIRGLGYTWKWPWRCAKTTGSCHMYRRSRFRSKASTQVLVLENCRGSKKLLRNRPRRMNTSRTIQAHDAFMTALILGN